MNSIIKNLTCIRRFISKPGPGFLAILGVMFLAATAQAQEDIRLRFFKPAPLRLTVSVNTTNTGNITNYVNLSTNIVGGVTLSVSNLPAGCGYNLATNGVNVGTNVNVANDVGLTITVNSTNIPQGEYTFYLLGEGGATNRMPFVLQSCYIWNGNGTNLALNTNAFSSVTFNWTNTPSWTGGNAPGTNSINDVFFGSAGAHTNRDASGIPSTNINITANVTVGSMRFGAGTFTNTASTNSLFHHVLIAGNTTLSVISNRGFSILRDYIAEYADTGGSGPDRKTGLMISGGGNGARLFVNNTNANVSMLLDNGASGDSWLNMTNLQTFEANVNRIGLGDFQLYPNYREMNRDTNGLGALPRRFVTTVILARTNLITTSYKSPDNYTNDLTRSYGIMWLNGETSGNGSSVNSHFHFGFTNVIKSDGVCFVGANHASGNSGFARFRVGQNNNGAIFRSTGNGRMSHFTISDGGGTNDAGSNIKANIDFWGGMSANLLDVQTTNFYIARDRSIISESNTVNYSGNFTMGKGTVDTINAILGYQEHQVKLNNASPQLGYCQGNITITNGGLFKVVNQLTLGYTADTNDVGTAQQYNTYGRVTVDGASLVASNIVVDGGPRNYSHTEGTDRQDFIKLIGASLTVTNTIGALPGQPLNLFSTERSTNTFFVNPSRTNLVCRQLSTPGTAASIIRIAGLTGVGSYPATVPIIKYEVATSPFLQADVTPVTNAVPGLNGYLLDNEAGQTVDLFLTTNAPKTLLWTGSVNNNWDTNTANWIPFGGGAATKFSIGDVAIFDDSSAVTNVNVVTGGVVPGQSGAGVIVSNSVRKYTFSGGVIAGTGLLRKVGSQSVTFTCTNQGPVVVLEGSITVGVGGNIGLTTIASNITLNVIGTINGGLTSTGTVTVAAGGLIAGPTTLVAGSLDNSGTVSTAPGALTLDTINAITVINQASGVLNPGGPANTQWTLNSNSVLANFGVINNLVGRLNVYGFMYGTNTVSDPDSTGGGGGLFPAGIDGRLEVRNPTGVLSPGLTPTNSIGTMSVFTRFDFDGVNGNGWGALLIEVDKSNAQTNDQIAVDYWSNIQGKIAMRNINPGMPFAAGDFFRVLIDNNSPANPYGHFNQPDNTVADHPVMDPVVPGPGLQWDLTDFRNYGVIKVVASPMIWNGNVGTAWDTNGANLNWQGGIAYTNTVGAVFDESSVSKTVVVSSIVAPGGYSLTTNIPSPGTTNVFTNSVGFSPGIIVSNTSTYLFSSTGGNVIEGWTGLYKTGSGTLDLGNMTNRFSGPVIVDQGVVVVSVYTNNGAAGPLGAPGLAPDNRAPSTSERLIMGGGSTLRFSGLSTNAADRGMTIVAGGTTLEISNSASHLLLGGTFRGDGGALTKTGPGTLTLGQSANSMTNLTVNNGQLRFSAAAAGAGHLIVNGGWLGFTNNVSMTNLINLAVNTAIENTNTTTLGGSFTGVGNVTVSNVAPSLFIWTRDLTNYTGNITFVGNGTNRFNNATNSNNARGSAGTVFDLGLSGWLENFNGGATNGGGSPLTYDLGGLAGGAGARLTGRATNNGVANGVSIYSIGAKGSDTTFAGTIQDGVSAGTVVVVKVGGGKLTLSGASTYSGGTTVSNGTLLANGVASTGTGTNTVAGGTLGGTGSISGRVEVLAGGTFSPGTSPGTLTVSNNVVLSGTTLMELTPATNDLLRVTGTLTAGGTLTVTNIGGTLTNGTIFTLFNQAAPGFTTTLPAGYVWTDNIGTAGAITLVSGGISLVNTTPTNITSSVSGSTLTLSWPSDHTGWSLQTQTNTLAVGLTPATNTWFNVSGSSATNSVSVTIDPLQPTVFYRLVYP